MAKMAKVLVPTLLISGSLLSACLPQHLAKYQKRNESPGAVAASSPKVASEVKASAAPPSEGEPSRQATIYAVDKNTYRFSIKSDKVWNAVLDVLMRNYNLNIVSRNSGVVTTEWDSFYLDGRVYRNKISVRIAGRGRNYVTVTIHNNVEILKDEPAIASVWLPAEDNQGESSRIVQNMALVLRQPPPVLPGGTAVAKGQTAPSAK